MKKKISCHLGHARTIISILMMFGCSKSNEYTGPLHDTVYTFSTKIPLSPEKVAASADSVQVRYVILQASSEQNASNFSHLFDANQIKTIWLDPSINATHPEKRNKLRGAGTLYQVKDGAPEAEQWLKDFGFSLGRFSSLKNAHR